MGDGIGDMAFWLAIGGIGVAFFVAMTPVFKALGTRISGRSGDNGRLTEIEQRLEAIEGTALTSGEVESQFSRFDELEGRLDFAERMITQQIESVPVTSGETPV